MICPTHSLVTLWNGRVTGPHGLCYPCAWLPDPHSCASTTPAVMKRLSTSTTILAACAPKLPHLAAHARQIQLWLDCKDAFIFHHLGGMNRSGGAVTLCCDVCHLGRSCYGLLQEGLGCHIPGARPPSLKFTCTFRTIHMHGSGTAPYHCL